MCQVTMFDEKTSCIMELTVLDKKSNFSFQEHLKGKSVESLLLIFIFETNLNDSVEIFNKDYLLYTLLLKNKAVYVILSIVL